MQVNFVKNVVDFHKEVQMKSSTYFCNFWKNPGKSWLVLASQPCAYIKSM